MNLTKLNHRWAASPNPTLRALSHTISEAMSWLRSLTNPRLRSEKLTRLRHRDRHFQGSTKTAANRYPALFQKAKELTADIPAPKILSFGCSTGEEAQTLAIYFPNAEIIGADINPWAFAQARKLNPTMHFVNSASPEFDALPTFDIVFALAVFQRTENRQLAAPTIQTGFTFARFEAELARLDQHLKPGGLLILDHTNFRFEETVTATHYSLVDCPEAHRPNYHPLYNRNNELHPEPQTLHRIFRKHSN